MVNHGERDHALLSASGASRWINCPPSARLTDAIPDNRNSEYALQGEAAHEYSELLLKCYLSGNDGADVADVEDFTKDNPYFDDEMREKVGEYVDYVIETYENEEMDMLTTYMAIEQQLDYSDWAEDGFGTGDILIVNDARLHIIDLKYGKGVPVYADDNSQLKMYALGAFAKFMNEYDFHEIVLHIVQPRLNNFSSFRISNVDELLEWGEEVVKPAAKLAFAGEGEFKAGEHCRWCKVKGNCQARADENLLALEHEFQDPALIPDDEIGSILHLAMQLKSWASDVESYVKKQVLQGKQVDGWKQVRGRSTRKFTDIKAVEQRLIDDFWEDHAFKEPELKSLSVIEKELGKKAFKELLGDLVEVSEGNPTLAPESDPRKAVNTVISDFEDEEFDV